MKCARIGQVMQSFGFVTWTGSVNSFSWLLTADFPTHAPPGHMVKLPLRNIELAHGWCPKDPVELSE